LAPCLLFTLNSAWAQGSRSLADELRSELQAMRTRQQALEEENRLLRTKLDDIEARLAPTPPTVSESMSASILADATESKPPVKFTQGGGGFTLNDGPYSFSLFGFAQGLGSVYDSKLQRSDGNGDFNVRAARLDFFFDYANRYQLLVEVDTAPGNGVPGGSDFGLVVASLNTKVIGNALQIEAGKLTDPFSTENYRTSRDVDTIERFMALNSLFILPALDSQYGAVIKGELGKERKFGYFFGTFNGNADAFNNTSDSNDSKELVAKLTYARPGFSAGLGLDYSRESSQLLSLTDLSFANYLTVPIQGERFGIGADAFWEWGRWTLRTEGLAFRFNVDRTPPLGIAGLVTSNDRTAVLSGAFIQPTVYLRGNRTQGMELLLRGEFSRLEVRGNTDGDTLYALTLGMNWYLSPNLRLQTNSILHYFNGPSRLLGFREKETVPLLLTELQIKF
jgi:phosphate-selective porin